MTLDEETAKNFFEQILNLWVIPEIDKRRKKNNLPIDFAIDKIQIIISPDESSPIVRLNKEIKAEITCELEPGISKQVTGEPVYWKEVKDILDIKLSDIDDPDAAHITMILFRKGWKIKFDLRQNKRKAKERYDAAKEFLNLAKKALEEGNLRAFTDILFSAVELFVTSQLFVISEQEYVKKATHSWTQLRYNLFINNGNYKKEYKTAFNKLSGFRDAARYFNKPFKLTTEDAKEMLQIAEDLEKFTEKMIM